jgi:hypothetical protein
MATTFTIFNHGTSSHRSRKDGEIIAELGRLANGTEYVDYLINDGPGSSGTTDNPMPGTYDPYTRDKVRKSVSALKDAGFEEGERKGSLKDPKFMSMKKPSTLGGLALGQGWDDNVIHSIATISELSNVPQTVNMIGWSRGAVTCTMIAYTLAEIYPQIAVNIFAIDPVAGLGNKGNINARTIQSNVRNYIGVLAMDEQRTNFEPQDRSRMIFDDKVNAIFLPFPGRHDTPVKLTGSPPEAGRMVWMLGLSFLRHFGTRFSSGLVPHLPPQEVCNAYGRIRMNRFDYRALRQRWYQPDISNVGGVVRQREFMTNIDKYVVDADYFINEHHRQTFMRTYPKVYAYLFEGKKGNERQVWEEFRSMYNLTGLMNSLAIFGVKRPKPGHPFVLPYPGSGHQRGGKHQLYAHANMTTMGVL